MNFSNYSTSPSNAEPDVYAGEPDVPETTGLKLLAEGDNLPAEYTSHPLS